MTALHSDAAGRARVRTTVGIPVGRVPRLSPQARRVVRRQLELGPFLEAFEAVDRVRDIAGAVDRAHLALVNDDELLDAIDRDAELRRRVG
jgi:hypothetical protein